MDPKDTAYLALSLELDIPLWTNDKKLIQGLTKKGYTKIITTEEIFRLTIEKE
ncbi:MAG: PIN domain-containing protein [bacterium]